LQSVSTPSLLVNLQDGDTSSASSEGEDDSAEEEEEEVEAGDEYLIAKVTIHRPVTVALVQETLAHPAGSQQG
jgi:hypothetical protein